MASQRWKLNSFLSNLSNGNFTIEKLGDYRSCYVQSKQYKHQYNFQNLCKVVKKQEKSQWISSSTS